MKLFLYSFAFTLSKNQAERFARLVGKAPEGITIAVIDGAADIIPDSAGWVEQARDTLRDQGFTVHAIDLRTWNDHSNKDELYAALASADAIWIGGGNTFYLRWLLRESGADKMIVELVTGGKVYAGWSAGAIVAGPTLDGIELMEETEGVPEIIHEGLGLTDVIVVPHMDNPDFSEAATKTNEALMRAGQRTQPLTDTQAFVVTGTVEEVML